MIGYQIAAQTKCFNEPIRKALHTAARLQCNGVQIDVRSELPQTELSQTGVRQFRKMLADLNLRVGSVAFPTRRGLESPHDLERRLEATRAAMVLGSQLESRVLVCNLGELPGEPSTLTEALLNLAMHGNRLGVQIVVQAAATDPEEISGYIASLPEGTLALDLHPAQLIANGHSPQEFVSRIGQYIAHVHAVDGVYDLANGQGVEVELGRGSSDFPELLGGLEEFGYRGWLTIERRASRQPIEDIGNAVQFLRTL
ncbi:MAG: hypothetical protein CMJ72_01330 [Planctomycetaceae bacterium]|nr:hypothetical protein [Planctomycetaceae bacterium]